MKIKFIKDPGHAPYNLAYNVGEVWDLPDALAQQLCEDGIAHEDKPEIEGKPKTENASMDSEMNKDAETAIVDPDGSETKPGKKPGKKSNTN